MLAQSLKGLSSVHEALSPNLGIIVCTEHDASTSDTRGPQCHEQFAVTMQLDSLEPRH